MALTDVEVLQASLATCSLKRASYLFMYPSGLDLVSNSRGSLHHGGLVAASMPLTPLPAHTTPASTGSCGGADGKSRSGF
ncbi:hypothetical protein, partial [Stenotrophomonas maltophilia]|uniref:hypothetical protein n=1 Tax=Stenotrophomonas maltophilia TaxID=40324 RepID=UPI001EE4CA9C